MNSIRQIRVEVCSIVDLEQDAGVAVKVEGKQIALFYLPEETPSVYAVDNFDPIGEVNVLSRGIVGDKSGELVVASPLYKQHYNLVSGKCLEDENVMIQAYSVTLDEDAVVVWV